MFRKAKSMIEGRNRTGTTSKNYPVTSVLIVSDSVTHGLSPPGSSVHGTFQARTLEWVAISFLRVSSQPRDQTHLLHWQVDSLPWCHLGKPCNKESPVPNVSKCRD